MTTGYSGAIFSVVLKAVTAFAVCWSVPNMARAESAETPVEELSFAAFFKRPIGSRGLEISDDLRSADGRQVRLAGYMVAREEAVPGRFLIAPRPVRLSEHADGDADDLPPATVTVLLDPSQVDRIVEHRAGPVVLQGRLHVGRSEDLGGRVSWFRLQLDPQAMAPDHSPTAPLGRRRFP